MATAVSPPNPDLDSSTKSQESDDLKNFSLQVSPLRPSEKEDSMECEENIMVKEFSLNGVCNKDRATSDDSSKPSSDETSSDKMDDDSPKPSSDKRSGDKKADDPSEDKPSEDRSKPLVNGITDCDIKKSSDCLKDKDIGMELVSKIEMKTDSDLVQPEITAEKTGDVETDAKTSEDKAPNSVKPLENIEKADETSEIVTEEKNAVQESSEPSTSSSCQPATEDSSDQGENKTPSTTALPLDEDSSSSVFENRLKDQGRKRRRLDDNGEDELTESGCKRVKVSKKHNSDGEQEERKEPGGRKARRSSCSEVDLLRDLDRFKEKQTLVDGAKGEKWKPAELTPEEKKRLELANAREKKMRENVLRVIQRNYATMSVEDLEDAIYVAMMDYFCHYNPTSLLQHKVFMLEKQLAKLQENYNRTSKQFYESKYLLKRMVEIRREEAASCICKDKLPFKMIRSVAVQVQTSRCRGGDLCPGSGLGLNQGTSSSRSPAKQQATSAALRRDPESSPLKQAPPTPSPQPSSTGSSGSSGGNIRVTQPPRQITVSSPAPQPATPPGPKPPEPVHRVSVQSPAQLAARALRASPSVAPPSKESQPAKQPSSSVVIDLTDKDEDSTGVVSSASQQVPSAPTAAPSQTKPMPTVVQQSFASKVKQSISAPIAQLPPLPETPLYQPLVKRPPQPVLKVCKADQSGIMLSWSFRGNVTLNSEINFYQVYACQENGGGGVTKDWSIVGDVKALPLPMACNLSQFREGNRYHFVVRAVDKCDVLGEFSHPASILLVTKNISTAMAPSPQARALGSNSGVPSATGVKQVCYRK